jgi:hypothetical protein
MWDAGSSDGLRELKATLKIMHGHIPPNASALVVALHQGTIHFPDQILRRDIVTKLLAEVNIFHEVQMAEVDTRAGSTAAEDFPSLFCTQVQHMTHLWDMIPSKYSEVISMIMAKAGLSIFWQFYSPFIVCF